MSALSHSLIVSKKAILETFSLIGLVDVLVFLGCFLIFTLLYLLACMLVQVRFFIPQFFKFLAFLVFFASPVFVFWFGQNILYKNEVDFKMAKRLEYSPTYLADGVVNNVGKRIIGHCYLIVQGLRNPTKKRHIIANAIFPLKTYKYRIDEEIPRGGFASFREVINDFNFTSYRERVECYGRK